MKTVLTAASAMLPAIQQDPSSYLYYFNTTVGSPSALHPNNQTSRLALNVNSPVSYLFTPETTSYF